MRTSAICGWSGTERKKRLTLIGAKRSAKMDFSDYDRAPEDALNRILWRSIKGPNVPMPAPVRSAAVRTPGHAAHGATAGRRDADDD